MKMSSRKDNRLPKTSTPSGPSNKITAGRSTPCRSTSSSESKDSSIFNIISKLSDQITELNQTIGCIATRLTTLENEVKGHRGETRDIKLKLNEVVQSTGQISNYVESLDMQMCNDKTNQIIIEECLRIKEGNSVIWKETMNERKKSFWHGTQNFGKAKLYTGWIEDSPEYLPLKYRPKVNTSDSQITIDQKVILAKIKYRDEIKLLYQYSEDHDLKVLEVDSHMNEIIENITSSELHRNVLLQMWAEETEINENISRQLWTKRLEFLKRKKEEEEASGTSRTIDENSQIPQIKKRDKFKNRRKRGFSNKY